MLKLGKGLSDLLAALGGRTLVFVIAGMEVRVVLAHEASKILLYSREVGPYWGLERGIEAR